MRKISLKITALMMLATLLSITLTVSGQDVKPVTIKAISSISGTLVVYVRNIDNQPITNATVLAMQILPDTGLTLTLQYNPLTQSYSRPLPIGGGTWSGYYVQVSYQSFTPQYAFAYMKPYQITVLNFLFALIHKPTIP